MSDLYAPRWRGQSGRLEVWYSSLTDPGTGLGLWIHHELVASTDGSARLQGWAAAFPPGETPVVGRFGPIDVPDHQALQGAGTASGSDRAYLCLPDVWAGLEKLCGEAAPLRWELDVEHGGRPLFTFPKWSWERELLPASQIVPSPAATFTGVVHVSGRAFTVRGAHGAIARIYGHGNAQRWGWLHADLGGGDVLELVAAVSTRPVMRLLPPLPLLQLRVGDRDWPRNPLLAAPLLRAKLELPDWTVRGYVGRHRVRIAVRQAPEESVTLHYDNPDGPGPVCVNSERASADVLIERWAGRWTTEHQWRLDRCAHAEIGRVDTGDD